MRPHHIGRWGRGCQAADRATAVAVQRISNSPPTQLICSLLDVSRSSAVPVKAHRFVDVAVRVDEWTRPTRVLVVREREVAAVFMAAMVSVRSISIHVQKTRSRT